MGDAELLDVATLRRELGAPTLRVLDGTVFLRRTDDSGPYTIKSGAPTFADAHVPGALFVDLARALTDERSPAFFALPSATRVQDVLGAMGVGPEHDVVVYAQESPMWATRLWWLLRYFGFASVRVLDGGLGAWRRAGFALTSDVATYPATTFVARPRPDLLATRADVEALLGRNDTCLVNALEPAAFRGDGPGAYSRPGRIPGSASVPARRLLDPDTGRFLSRAALREQLADVDDGRPVVAYCGGGVSATVVVFAWSLLERDDVRLYDGSLSEWTADPSLPLEVG